MTDQATTNRSPIRNISDTARWVVYDRARETIDPTPSFAIHLPNRWPASATATSPKAFNLPSGTNGRTWSHVFDRRLHPRAAGSARHSPGSQSGRGAGHAAVSHEAAGRLAVGRGRFARDLGLQARHPQKREADLPPGADPIGSIQHRREAGIVARLAGRAQNVLVLTEGLLIYLTPEEAARPPISPCRPVFAAGSSTWLRPGYRACCKTA